MKSIEDTIAGENLSLTGKKEYYSTDLFTDSNEIIILHGKEQYRLKITRLNKLILTK